MASRGVMVWIQLRNTFRVQTSIRIPSFNKKNDLTSIWKLRIKYQRQLHSGLGAQPVWCFQRSGAAAQGFSLGKQQQHQLRQWFLGMFGTEVHTRWSPCIHKSMQKRVKSSSSFVGDRRVFHYQVEWSWSSHRTNTETASVCRREKEKSREAHLFSSSDDSRPNRIGWWWWRVKEKCTLQPLY